MSYTAQQIARRTGYAMLWIILLAMPAALLAGGVTIDVFIAIELIWLFIAMVLIIGPDSISEVSFGKASIKRYMQAAEADAKAAEEAKREALRAREDAERIRDQLRELARVSVENSYILSSAIAKNFLPPNTAPAVRLATNMNTIWLFAESDPRAAHYARQDVRALFGHPPIPFETERSAGGQGE